MMMPMADAAAAAAAVAASSSWFEPNQFEPSCLDLSNFGAFDVAGGGHQDDLIGRILLQQQQRQHTADPQMLPNSFGGLLDLYYYPTSTAMVTPLLFPPAALPQQQQQVVQDASLRENATPWSAPASLSGATLFQSGRLRRRHARRLKEPSRNRILSADAQTETQDLRLEDLKGRLAEVCREQVGSRFVQKKLQEATEGEKEWILAELRPSAVGLMTDAFGNYVVQKFLEFGSLQQVAQIICQIRDHVDQLAVHPYGCRVVQKALDSTSRELRDNVGRAIERSLIKLSTDQNGSHVVQKCLRRASPSLLRSMLTSLQGQVGNLSSHPHGCRVVQLALELGRSDDPGLLTGPILDELRRDGHVGRLVSDQYGNYVVQHMITHGRKEDRSHVMGVVKGRAAELSRHKFASNVVEKCVEFATRREMVDIIEELRGGECLYSMSIDPYANYVVQKMLDRDDRDDDVNADLAAEIMCRSADLAAHPAGRHVLSKLVRKQQQHVKPDVIGHKSRKSGFARNIQ